MALEDLRNEMETCRRCSACKFMPFEKVTGYQPVNVCPSISKYNFHTYSAGGRMVNGVALLEKRIDFSPKFMEVMYNCQVCGACDVSCKYAMDMEVLEPIYETRIKAVEEGHTSPILDKVINSLRKQGTMVPGAKARRGDWAAGLNSKDCTKDKVDVVYHVGCQTSYNKDMWKLARATVRLLQKAGVNFGTGGENETCCGGRAYQMGYKEDFLNQAKKNMAMIKKSGAKTLVTACADGYHAFKVLYDKFDLKGDLEVLHITEYLARLIKEGKLKPKKKVDIAVTYHDPCHLGRLGEPFIHWKGKEIPGHIRIFEPYREFRRGTCGVYEPPRDVLKSIPGLKLVEMVRTKEYAWCCGAGGGVSESNPDFSLWTAKERIEEAEDTGAAAIATACPWCIRNFNEAIKEKGSSLKVYDVIELLEKAI
ncbi:MAG TPA: (Fe-S)-binding protein [Dehalococcoidales bacterium]|nr:(Fe-S)-binding protein [Dehalococcoidales bacterium]